MKFDELSEKSKEKAREWYRPLVFSDSSYYDCMHEYFERVANILGIDFDQRQTRIYGNTPEYKPCIYWSGFSSQGDGACFEGSYTFKRDATAKIKEYAPEDKELERIAHSLQTLQFRKEIATDYTDPISATVTHRAHSYYHARSMTIEVGDEDTEVEEEIADAMRDFADWMYDQLEKEYDYQTSDEAVDENLIANEYDFDEDGSIA